MRTSLLQNDFKIHQGGKSRITVGTPLIQQHLTICDAYRSSTFLEILHVDQQVVLTKNKPLKYKECQEFMLPLMEGDRLDFKADGRDIGTFHATSMPKSSASLLLITRHREGSSRTLAFESHAFADVKNPQIAVVDAYSGNETRSVNIIENSEAVVSGQTPLMEALRFNSVVAVPSGRYNIALLGAEALANMTTMPLLAESRAKLVIMRVGGRTHQGVAFPQELVIYPKNSAVDRGISMVCVMVVALFFFAAPL